ncbi:expressed unknown protein [Seminavis robusta]|uniref:Uncharacterized protein n=1 Tax=Seminavis robusta TaxID=568900 RepID=A0A9N8H678_9STRA|nr:expressed unknown protein [Seminavis robusta]|eukprot:Sro38_g023790.1 n/a (219) ;mRNA; r:100228-100884
MKAALFLFSFLSAISAAAPTEPRRLDMLDMDNYMEDMDSSTTEGQGDMMGRMGNQGGGMMGSTGCQGHGRGHGGGGGCFMRVIHNLVNNRKDIQRNVTNTDTGAITYTWSSAANNNPLVSGWLKQHVASMVELVQEFDNGGMMIRGWDPLFRAVFDHSTQVSASVEEFDQGVKTTLTGNTPCAKSLVQMHAAVVSSFISRGWDEVHEPHDVPDACYNS